ncbi:MAG: hypothetical protein C0621_11055 [Desulfuromonas sp.]|nr:MAG: hypothetical protein C0621_11055 [Desulfuromonas sp.]
MGAKLSRLLKLFDRFCGGALLVLSPRGRRLTSVGARRILVLRPGGIGDAVLLVPALSSLRDYFPEARIDVLAEKRNAGAFSLTRVIDNVYRYDRPTDLWGVLCRRYDIVIDSEQWHALSAIVSRFAASGVTIGFDTGKRRRAFSFPVPYSHHDYEAGSFFHLLSPLGIVSPQTFSPPFLALPEDSRRCASEMLSFLNGKPYIVLFPGASISERRWGWENFASLASRLSEKGWKVVVVGGGMTLRWEQRSLPLLGA